MGENKNYCLKDENNAETGEAREKTGKKHSGCCCLSVTDGLLRTDLPLPPEWRESPHMGVLAEIHTQVWEQVPRKEVGVWLLDDHHQVIWLERSSLSQNEVYPY